MEESLVKKYHKELFDHFGYNFGFAADLLEKYLEDNSSVSEYWQNYFNELTGSENKTPSNGQTKKIISQSKQKVVSESYQINPEDEPVVIAGVGARIIENMESSLSIPTATSLRAVSVKLLEENRRLINQHLQVFSRPSRLQLLLFRGMRKLLLC